MPASSSLDRPVFKSNSLAQFQELNSVHRLLTGSSVFPCTEPGTFPRATCHSSCYPEDLDSGSSVPCPVHPKMRSKHLAGPPDKVICFPQKTIICTRFHTHRLHRLHLDRQFCKCRAHVTGVSDPTWCRSEVEFTELSFQQCLKGTVIHRKDTEDFPHLASWKRWLHG